MQQNSRIPVLKGKPFFDQLRLSINFIDTNMKLIENSVKTSNTNEEYDYVKLALGKVDKYNNDVNSIARSSKASNYLKRTANEFEDEMQNLKEILRCKEIDYRLEPFKYQLSNQTSKQMNSLPNRQNGAVQQVQQLKSIKMPNNFTHQERRLKLLNRNHPNDQAPIHHTDSCIDNQLRNSQLESSYPNKKQVSFTQAINFNSTNVNHMNSRNKCSSIKKKDTFIFKENQDSLIKKQQTKNSKFYQFKRDHLKENQADTTNESIDPSNQYSFDFKLPYNKLKNNFPSNYSVDESLEIEFTPGLKSRRTCNKKTFNESNVSTQDLQQFDRNGLHFDNSMKQDLSLIRNEASIKYDPANDKNQENYLKQNVSIGKDVSISKEPFIKIELNDKPFEQVLIKDISNVTDTRYTPSKNFDKFDEKLQKLSTPKKPPNFDLFNF